MLLAAMLVLAFGPLDWPFPWWLWILALLEVGYITVKLDK